MHSSDSDEVRSLWFSGEVQGDSIERFTSDLDVDARVEEVAVRFYQGPRLALRVRPFVRRERSGGRVERVALVDYADESDEFVSGDDDMFVLPTSVPVEAGETLGVEVENTTGRDGVEPHPYAFRAQLEIDEADGTSRWGGISAVTDSIRGVFS